LTTIIHSGRTDKKGGHNDRINGGYHYHHGRKAHSHINGICELDSATDSSSVYLLAFLLFLVVIYFFGPLIKRLK